VVTDAFASLPLEPPDPDIDVRCWRCAAMIARVATRPWVIDCRRCYARNQQGMPAGKTAEHYGSEPRKPPAQQRLARRAVG
jgi:phage FluMu protein Com